MKSQDLTELDWLAHRLRAVAVDVERAAVLLRAAGDLDRLQLRLAAVVADRDRDEVNTIRRSPAAGGEVQPTIAEVPSGVQVTEPGHDRGRRDRDLVRPPGEAVGRADVTRTLARCRELAAAAVAGCASAGRDPVDGDRPAGRLRF